MPNRSRQKGDRLERQLVKDALEWGHKAHRMPLSGAHSHYKGDILLTPSFCLDAPQPINLKGEVKWRANGFKQIYGWLDEFDFLVIKADGMEPLAVRRWRDWLGDIQ